MTSVDGGVHLSVDIVAEIHGEVLARFGGLDGIRDRTMLESAVAAPQATLGGASVFSDLTEVAAACLFYLCRNQPFLDGNKRTALGACILFLRLSGIETMPDGPGWETVTVNVASGRIDRDETTVALRSLVGR